MTVRDGCWPITAGRGRRRLHARFADDHRRTQRPTGRPQRPPGPVALMVRSGSYICHEDYCRTVGTGRRRCRVSGTPRPAVTSDSSGRHDPLRWPVARAQARNAPDSLTPRMRAPFGNSSSPYSFPRIVRRVR